MKRDLMVCVLLGCAGVAWGAPTVIIAGRTVMPDGSLAEGKAVVVEGGVIQTIEDAAVHADSTAALRYPDAVLCPGMVDIASQVGVVGETQGGVTPVEGDLSVLDAVDSDRGEFRRALEAGITAVQLVPSTSRIVSGRAATVRTLMKDGAVDVVRGDGPLVISMGGQVLDFDLGPTSRSGAVYVLRDALERAGEAGSSGALAEVVGGRLDAMAFCSAIDDVDAVLMTLGEHGVTPAVVHGAQAAEIAAQAEGERAVFVVGPLGFESAPEELTGPAALHGAGVKVALRGGTPFAHASSLRATAALSVAYGLPADAARRAVTTVAAEVAGVGDRVGSIAAGRSADLVLYSGDPVVLSSRVVRVWVGGELVHAPEPPAPEFLQAKPGGGS